MKIDGQQGEKHQRVVDYANWGLKYGIQYYPASEIQTTRSKDLLKQFINDQWQLISSARVNYTENRLLSDLIIYQRYEKKNKSPSGEYLSVVFDLQNQCLLGMTKMQKQVNKKLISHQEALLTAASFLGGVAPDLIGKVNSMPTVIKLSENDRVIFDPAIKLGNVELHWIDQHEEFVSDDEVVGMKVKMRDPSSGLWLWVIVNGDGEVITFERDVSWDFDRHIRQTPMWLHSEWLLAQKLAL